MKITNISCDICLSVFDYPAGTLSHEHPELEIGGVPMNIWTPNYRLPQVGKLQPENSFHEYIPVQIRDSCRGYGNTPLTRIPTGTVSGEVYIKDESANPTGSFKDRGMAVMVSDAVWSGKKKIATPSTGNAAISLGYYADKEGLESIVFIPEGTSQEKIKHIEGKSSIMYDPDIIKSYEHFILFCKENPGIYNGFPANNIAYLQGIKSMAYEIFMGLKQQVPDWIVVPVGSGGDMVGLYYGFKDLVDIGLAERIPRFAPVQVAGGDPITQGFNKGIFDRAVILDDISHSKAEAIDSDTSFNYFKLMDILRKTDGMPISVSDQEIESEIESNFAGYGDRYEFSSMSVFAALGHLKPHIIPQDKVALIVTAANRKERGDGDE